MGRIEEEGPSDNPVDALVNVSLANAARRRRRRRLFTALVGLGMAGVLTAVTSTLTSPNAKRSDATAGTETARKAVMAALHRASAARTADVRIHMEIRVGEQLFTITGSGVVDIDSQAAELGMSVTDGSDTKELKMIYLGGKAYEAIPELPRLEPGKAWISLDPAASRESGGQEPTALGVGGDPLALLSLLQLQSASVAQLGTVDVMGGKATGFYVNVSIDDIRNQASRGDLPDPLHLLAIAPLSSLSAQVYIDPEGRLIEDSITLAMTTADPVTMTNYLDFSNYGVAISVKAPPASSVITYQQLMQDLGNRQRLVL